MEHNHYHHRSSTACGGAWQAEGCLGHAPSLPVASAPSSCCCCCCANRRDAACAAALRCSIRRCSSRGWKRRRSLQRQQQQQCAVGSEENAGRKARPGGEEAQECSATVGGDWMLQTLAADLASAPHPANPPPPSPPPPHHTHTHPPHTVCVYGGGAHSGSALRSSHSALIASPHQSPMYRRYSSLACSAARRGMVRCEVVSVLSLSFACEKETFLCLTALPARPPPVSLVQQQQQQHNAAGGDCRGWQRQQRWHPYPHPHPPHTCSGPTWGGRSRTNSTKVRGPRGRPPPPPRGRGGGRGRRSDRRREAPPPASRHRRHGQSDCRNVYV